MSFQTSQPGTRAVYKAAQAEFAAAKILQQTSVLTQGELRSEIPLTANGTQFKIPILINDFPYQAGKFQTENRLNLQDAFVVGTISVLLSVPTGNGDYAFPIFSYPSLAKFTAAEQAALYALYNGWITLTVSQKVILTYWDLWKHWKVNQTQATVGVTAQTVFPIDEADFTTDGFYPVEPGIIHIGSTNIQMYLNLPQAIGTNFLANTRVIIIQRGILAQNVTSVTNN
jgi:hypothetical protein